LKKRVIPHLRVHAKRSANFIDCFLCSLTLGKRQRQICVCRSVVWSSLERKLELLYRSPVVP